MGKRGIILDKFIFFGDIVRKRLLNTKETKGAKFWQLKKVSS
ncbi:Uncharacterized protein dnm_084860 [Desulfonema magnum]|uniref:Uncharacterized protein n=1 Tax=Desulfonema magnum TaxID=45655 RepID=A0A975BV95_9BACT|nr:Uncharacterized protein dnm_084860 [Desulfonema magnum]